MKLRYLINDLADHFVQFDIDMVGYTIVATYVRGGLALTGHMIDATEVFTANSVRNPNVQIAKKGRVWDFHILNFDPYGKEVRRSIGLLLEDDLHPTKLEAFNDGTKDATLVDYTTHGLDVYNSTLQFAHFTFEDIMNLSGTSGSGLTAPAITTENQLKVGYDANITVDLLGQGEIDLATTPVAFFFKVDSFATNAASLMPQLEFDLIGHKISFATNGGIIYTDTVGTQTTLFSSADVVNGMTGKIEITTTQAFFYTENRKVELPNFARGPITTLGVKGFCDNGLFTLLDDIIVQGLENFRTDFIPPITPQEVDAFAGDSEVFLRWKPNAEQDLAGYHVYVNGNRSNINLIPSADYQVTGLQDGITYTISLVAVDKSGNESLPKTIHMRPISDTMYEVKDLNSYVNDMGVHFSWLEPSYTDYNGINVYRTDLDTGTTTKLVSLIVGETGYIDSPPPASGDYKYVITTFDVYGNETSGVEVHQWVPVAVDGTKITGLYYDNFGTVDKDTLFWNPAHLANNEIVSYNIYVDGQHHGNVLSTDPLHPSNDLVYYELGVAFDHTVNHVFSVTAVRQDGSEFGQQEITYTA